MILMRYRSVGVSRLQLSQSLILIGWYFFYAVHPVSRRQLLRGPNFGQALPQCGQRVLLVFLGTVEACPYCKKLGLVGSAGLIADALTFMHSAPKVTTSWRVSRSA